MPWVMAGYAFRRRFAPDGMLAALARRWSWLCGQLRSTAARPREKRAYGAQGETNGGSGTVTKRVGYGYKLTVRVNAEERRRLTREAERARLSVSRYLVASGLRGCPPPTAEERAQRQRAIFHAKKIGTNLNQIAHRLNGEALVPSAELRTALVATTQALAQLTGREKS